MNNPGLRNLGDVALAAINAATAATVVTSSTAATGETVDYIDRLEGMLSCTISANFNWGAGGTTCRVTVETSLDDGTTWTEVWRALFGTASEQNQINLSGLTPKTNPVTPAALSDDACLDGIFGTRWRARILVTGTYTGNTSLSLRMNAR